MSLMKSAGVKFGAVDSRGNQLNMWTTPQFPCKDGEPRVFKTKEAAERWLSKRAA